jgi:Icc-related predicted phosphoesterase
MRVVAISDTHALHQRVQVPEGDLLIHAGDLTRRGAINDVVRFNSWLEGLPHRHKVVIAGNHDFCFEQEPELARQALSAATYLQDEDTVIEGVRIYGSPWQPWFYDWAFNLPRGDKLRERWALIPVETQILVTHGPPLGHGDLTSGGEHAGCADLLDRIRVVAPAYHIFGHIHEGYGISQEGATSCLNASSCNLAYEPVQEPLVFDLG